ncbi:copper amine oxidase N-terminal domain-containing protein [Cohnella faecalis]|uniref:Copper amine oxidase N-terminal domain-containing protein n=1 Tax=Cohnella faecalis TaxID=2315694 RepID=A0A398CBT9_9BACL|nr:copper amine oxidase N-terminal domain-containing protein [Cohnella faecalis]RIE00243.1 copper amine oxidase N-terminal domain-containing protein [Cohnella faecalis]
MKSKLTAIALVFALIFTFALPAQAAAALDIKLKIGSDQMTVNGKASKITAPYKTGSTVMVPLAVVTKAIGAKLTLKNTKTITLTYQKHTVVVTIGSKAATFDGKKVDLAVAPVNKSNVTMVPTKVIEGLGAKVTINASTKEVRITVAATPATTTGGGTGGGTTGSTINTDAGKSKVGDSYYGWSINYPTGLVLDYQSEDGDAIEFRDVKKEYYLGVFVMEELDALTVEEKRQTLYGYFDKGESLVDKQTVKAAAQTYEKITSKNKEGFYFEYRGIQANGRMYVIIFGKKTANASELSRYTNVLDSFKTTFDASDRTLKNLTKIIAGYKAFKNADYGLSVVLPKEWTANTEDYVYPMYQSKNRFLSVEATSLVEGDTLDAWVKREVERFHNKYVEAYRKDSEPTAITWNGIQAKLYKTSFSNDTTNWASNYSIYAVQGNYRYEITYAFIDGQQADSESLFADILRTLKVDFNFIAQNFGTITDDSDLADVNATVTKTSRKYGYSITLPEQWYGVKKDFEKEEVLYLLDGGNFSIYVVEDVSDFSNFSWAIDEEYRKMVAEEKNMKVVESVTIMIAGAPAKKIVLENSGTDKENPSRSIAYFIWKNGKVYVAEGSYYVANGTEFITKQLETATNSFTFTN